MRVQLFMLPILLNASCTPAQVGCEFEYTDAVRQQVVLPALESEFGKDLIPYFNYENPIISAQGAVTKVILSPVNRVDGQMVMFENSRVIWFDNCSGAMTKSTVSVNN